MTHFLTLSKAARLIGVTRGALQQKIKNGNLPSFDGMVSADDLLLAYPDIKFEEDLLFERLTQIKEESFAKRVRERVLPSQEVLAARLYAQSRELADVRTHLQRYHSIIVRAQARLHEMGQSADGAFPPILEELEAWLNRQLEEVLDTEPPNPLAVLDGYLSVVATHVELRPSGHDFFVEGADTILKAALRSGLSLNYGCGNGNCGLCKARIVSGQTQKVHHHDYVLSEAEKNMGYVLMCSHAPVTDLIIEALEASGPSDIPQQEIVTRVKAVEPLSNSIMLLHLQTPRTNRLRFLAGQSVTLSIGSDAADFAVASCPCDDRNLQFHISNMPGNAFANRVLNGIKSGDCITVNGPTGEFVLGEESPRPIIFIACEAGFAPIKSLIEHAMAMDTGRQMTLYWIALEAGGHYMQNLCRAWSDALDDFEFHPLVIPDAQQGYKVALQAMDDSHPQDMGQFDIYLAGPEDFLVETRAWLQQRDFPQDQLSVFKP